MKATTKNLEGIFKVFCDSYGYRVAKNRLDEGALALWDNGTNSWSIARMLDNYGITMPFGHETYTKTELYYNLKFAIELSRDIKRAQAMPANAKLIGNDDKGKDLYTQHLINNIQGNL